MRQIKNLMMLLALGAVIASCEKENLNQPIPTSNDQAVSSHGKLVLNPSTQKSADVEVSENIGDIFDAVAPSECGTTALTQVQNKYINALIADPIALANNALYSDINYYYSFYLNNGDQYFGEDGDYTHLFTKRERELSKFWDMPYDVNVKGEHTANLDNRDVWIETLTNFYGYNQPDGSFVPLSQEQAAEIADEQLALNELSPNLPENPYFASDGFSSTNGTIVIGDGLPQWLEEAGVDAKIVWTGILSHEWAHQIQFLNRPNWYPNGAVNTRYTELEADFMAAYFMTHKRGATYNRKRVEEFFELFFDIGDCSFTSSGHHGTPLQRMAATKLGFDLADQAQKQGHILTQQQAHDYFTAHVAGIL